MPTARRLLLILALALGIPAALLAAASVPAPPVRPAGPPRLAGARACQGPLSAGVAEVRLELPPDTPIGGFARLRYGSEGVRDPVGARALVLSAGACRVAIASAEILLVPDALEAAVRARIDDLPLDGLLLTATHTHAGPGGYWEDLLGERLGVGPYDPAMRDRVAGALAGAIRQAAGALAPARLSMGRGEAPELVRNRAGGLRDARLTVLRLDRPDGAPLAELAIFAAHPTTLGKANRRISGDWPGRFLSGGGHGLRLLLQGAVGDQSVALPGVARVTPEPYGDALSAAVDALRFGPPEPATALGFARAEVSLPAIAPPVPRLLARAAANLTREALPARASVAALRLGPVLLLAVPGEPVAEEGARLRAEVGAGAEGVSLADGYVGYVETAARVAAGAGEARRSYYGPDLAPRLERAAAAAARAARAGAGSP
jgi:hypothetical protein